MNLHQLIFDLPLRHDQLPGFRGAFAALAGREHDVFHNHDNDAGSDREYKHRYPLVQYRVHDGRAAVVGINEGADGLERLVKGRALEQFEMNGYAVPLEVVHSRKERGLSVAVLPGDEGRVYRIYHYLPLGPENYRDYKGLPSLVDKVRMLERLLQNHIVSMALGTGGVLGKDDVVQVVLQDIDRVQKVKVLGTAMMAFDVVFRVNVELPEGIGLGRKVAFGFGAVWGIEN